MKNFKDEKHRDKIINRIQKLLNVANGTSESGYTAEAETAMKMAQNYMKSYGLSMSQIELKESMEEAILEATLDSNSTIRKWETGIALAVCVVCDCQIITRSKTFKSTAGNWKTIKNLVFIGYEKDTQLAKLLYRCFHASARSQAKKQYPESHSRQRSFLCGLANRLNQRAKQEKNKATSSTSFALIVVEKEKNVKDWMSQNLQLRTVKPRKSSIDYAAYTNGIRAANKMDLGINKKIK
jgi:hypothetical protein